MTGLPQSTKNARQSGINANGKLGAPTQPRQPPICPECGSSRVCKAGFRKTRRGKVQRYQCWNCGLRFSESMAKLQVKVDVPGEVLERFDSQADHADRLTRARDFSFKKRVDHLPLESGENVRSHNTSQSTIVEKALNKAYSHTGRRRVCAEEVEAKNLAGVEPQKERAIAGATMKPSSAEVKGKILEFSFWMLKEGYAESTIKCRTSLIRTMVKRGADLYDSEGIKSFIATQKTWSEGRKRNAAYTYSCFLKMEGLTWDPPRYKRPDKLPFIPLETEIDQLIAGCGKKVSSFLQGLKETGADPGELWRVEWTDIDVERKVVGINHPVKGHNARVLPISNKWINMLERLPKTGKRVFGNNTRGSHDHNFRRQRCRVAAKLGNSRLLTITFTTLRHWKGTMEYHKTKDILHVKKILGHKSIESTMLYINLEAALFQAGDDEFVTRVPETMEEACRLIESGFEYHCDWNAMKIFRRRK